MVGTLPRPSPIAVSSNTIIIEDYGWTGWQPLPLDFCNNALPNLVAAGVDISREIQNDCDPGDRQAISNATIEEGKPQPRA